MGHPVRNRSLRALGENAAPPPINMTPRRLSVNLGNIGSITELTRFEDWLSGRKTDMVDFFTGWTDWTNYTDTVSYVYNLYIGMGDKDIEWSIPMFITGGSYATAAGGSYDVHWKDLAELILLYHSKTRPHGPILIRLAYEFNYQFIGPWQATGDVANFLITWRRCVDVFRSVSRRFKFEWCPAFVDSANIVQYWPGDNWVDIVGIDIYVYLGSPQGSGPFTGDPAGAISYYITGSQQCGLTQMKAFADAHGKPLTVSEWGCGTNGFESFIDAWAAALTSKGVLHHGLWNQGASSPYDSRLDDESYPTTGSAFQKNFGYWTPKLIPGLSRLYFTKQTFRTATNGVAQSAWDDLSPSNVNGIQATGADQPTKQTRNGYPELQFDGVSDHMTIGAVTMGTAASYTLLVARHNGSGNFASAVDFGAVVAGQQRTLGTNFSKNIFASCNGAGNDHDSGVAWGVGDRIVSWRLDPAVTAGESILNIDGGADNVFNMSGTAINTPSGTARIGSRTDGTSFWPGGVQLMIQTTIIPSTLNRQKAEGWAAWELGLQATLDPTHPYRYERPLI